MELTYHEGADGILYPDLKMKEQEDYELGKYGNLRWNYLRTQKRALFQILLMKDELWEHLVDKETYMTNNTPDVLTAKDLQAYLHISRAGAYNLLSRADFPTLHIGKRKLVTLRNLQEWMAKNTGESTL